jgi:hypothetical protein
MHGKVAILRMPSDVETQRIIEWLHAHPGHGESMEGLAEFYVDVLESGVGENDVLGKRIAKPALNSTRVALGEP